jgi:predicted nuclease with TOPRIM domain
MGVDPGEVSRVKSEKEELSVELKQVKSEQSMLKEKNTLLKREKIDLANKLLALQQQMVQEHFSNFLTTVERIFSTFRNQYSSDAGTDSIFGGRK